MGRGRPPKPTATHKAKGTFREDRHGGLGRATAEGGVPECPAGFEGAYRRAWDVIVGQAQHVHGLVTLADATALETCAVALVRYWQVRAAVDALVSEPAEGEEEGTLSIVVNASHGPRVRPEFAEERAAEDRLVAALNRFGLTPQARASMRLVDAGGGEDPFEKLAREIGELAAAARDGRDVDEPASSSSAKATAAKKTARKAKATTAKKTPSTNRSSTTTKKTAAKKTTSSSSAKAKAPAAKKTTRKT